MTKIGSSIDGKYDVIDLIGEGGMSRVWLARDKRLNKLWAVKEIGRTAKDANNTVVIQSLIAEANLMKQLDHPALPRIVDIIENEQTTYVVMDYIEGESLNKTMRRLGHPMDVEDVIDWGIQLCDVLEYLHTRKPPVIYRDMKPGNIMLRDDNTVKLIDFGIAREYKEEKSSDTKILGTQGYAAPEQFSRHQQSDVRTDIYSLGVTLYHLVTGRGPLDDTVLRPIREINPQLPEGLERIIQKAVQQDPEKRYQSCAEMRYDLEHYEQLTEEYQSVQQAKLKRFKLLWVSAIVLVAIGVVCMLASVYLRNSTYESYLTQAQMAEASEVDGAEPEAEKNYKAAIEVQPTSLQPYRELLEMYRSNDTVRNGVASGTNNFTMTEAARWSELFSKRRDSISGSNEFADLCFDVGTLYLVYYENEGESQDSAQDTRAYALTAGVQAAQWFERAIQSYDANKDSTTLTVTRRTEAEIYLTIGQFYQKLSQATLEGNEGSVYEGYWDALENVVDIFERTETTSADGEDELSSDTAVMVKLRLYQLVYEAVGSPTYLNGFRRVGVDEYQVLDIYGKVTSHFQYGGEGVNLDPSVLADFKSIFESHEEDSKELYDAAQPNARASKIYESIQSSASATYENIVTVYGNAASIVMENVEAASQSASGAGEEG